ncbi:uncharacterized protein [Spinacia oleracea]|uniref:Uncharacterized protein isoform X3 n=1 Tax=Spinacia oleracea TaxID=3562 RepID=A0ABM3RKP2_SPIOL|nr:uncharacterized protein LOC110796599 isoform X3 [Spinacia oleracea]
MEGEMLQGCTKLLNVHINYRCDDILLRTCQTIICVIRWLEKVEVEFADGRAFNLSAEFLRVYSPAADSKIRSIGGEKVIFGRRHVGIMSAEPVGNYGVRNMT